jgi:hypothetical protein
MSRGAFQRTWPSSVWTNSCAAPCWSTATRGVPERLASLGCSSNRRAPWWHPHRPSAICIARKNPHPAIVGTLGDGNWCRRSFAGDPSPPRPSSCPQFRLTQFGDARRAATALRLGGSAAAPSTSPWLGHSPSPNCRQGQGDPGRCIGVHDINSMPAGSRDSRRASSSTLVGSARRRPGRRRVVALSVGAMACPKGPIARAPCRTPRVCRGADARWRSETPAGIVMPSSEST